MGERSSGPRSCSPSSQTKSQVWPKAPEHGADSPPVRTTIAGTFGTRTPDCGENRAAYGRCAGSQPRLQNRDTCLRKIVCKRRNRDSIAALTAGLRGAAARPLIEQVARVAVAAGESAVGVGAGGERAAAVVLLPARKSLRSFVRRGPDRQEMFVRRGYRALVDVFARQGRGEELPRPIPRAAPVRLRVLSKMSVKHAKISQICPQIWPNFPNFQSRIRTGTA